MFFIKKYLYLSFSIIFSVYGSVMYFLSRRSVYRHKTNIGQSTSIYSCRDRRLENLIILLCAKITVRWRLVVTLFIDGNTICIWNIALEIRTYTQFLLQKRCINIYIFILICIYFQLHTLLSVYTIFYIFHYRKRIYQDFSKFARDILLLSKSRLSIHNYVII